MAATLAAARGAFPGRRLVLAFQPHRYTRTRDCFEDFVKVMGSADAVLLAEVYAAGEAPIVAADGRALARALRVLTHPVAGGLIFTLCFSMWHFPELYEAALRSRPLHVLEHWSMFLPAILMVWPLFSLSAALPRIGYGQAMFYSFALMIADLPLWAVLIFGDHPIYETYRLAPRVSGLSAADDMILGAAVMKGFNEVFALGCMLFKCITGRSPFQPSS